MNPGSKGIFLFYLTNSVDTIMWLRIKGFLLFLSLKYHTHKVSQITV